MLDYKDQMHNLFFFDCKTISICSPNESQSTLFKEKKNQNKSEYSSVRKKTESCELQSIRDYCHLKQRILGGGKICSLKDSSVTVCTQVCDLHQRRPWDVVLKEQFLQRLFHLHPVDREESWESSISQEVQATQQFQQRWSQRHQRTLLLRMRPEVFHLQQKYLADASYADFLISIIKLPSKNTVLYKFPK